MTRIVVSKELKNKFYYWYVARSLYALKSRGTIELIEVENTGINEKYVELIKINGRPIFIDLNDDISLNSSYKNFSEDSIILKGNCSIELFESPPEIFEYRVQDWYWDIKSQIHPFALGRAFAIPLDANEFKEFPPLPMNKNSLVVSYSGEGLFELQTSNRLKVYDMFKSILGDRANLTFYRRNHYTGPKLDLRSYEVPTSPSLNQYFGLLMSGKYSINMAGIAGSQPFRFTDSVLAGRASVSTKVYHDLYKTFPCIELPICGYTGLGDWELAKKIVSELPEDTTDLVNKSKEWYQKYLSIDGMFNNQLMRYL